MRSYFIMCQVSSGHVLVAGVRGWSPKGFHYIRRFLLRGQLMLPNRLPLQQEVRMNHNSVTLKP